jgi:hypothetical protein
MPKGKLQLKSRYEKNLPHQPFLGGEGILNINLVPKRMEGEPIISIIFTRLRGALGGANLNTGMQGYGYIDGEFVAMSDDAASGDRFSLSVGDMCYDALDIHNDCYFGMDDHLDRFEHAVAERRYNTLGMRRAGFADILMECASRTELCEFMVNIAAARGVPTSGHKDLRTCQNRLMVWAKPYY